MQEDNVSLRKAEPIAILGLVLQLIFAALAFLLYAWNRIESNYALGWLFFCGSAIWFLSLLHMRQKRLAHDEELTEKQYTQESHSTTLFEGREIDPLSARTQLKTFEKWVVPGATLLFGMLFLAVAAYQLYYYSQYYSLYLQTLEEELQKALDDDIATGFLARAPITAAFLVGFAFFSLLLSKFSIGLAEQKSWRLLRAGGSYLLIASVTSFLAAIATISLRLESLTFEGYLTGAISLLPGIIGLEMLLALVLDIYRPRVRGQEIRYPYDSRFLELFTGSKGIWRTAAHAINYQFGFNISGTWFYQFLEKAIAPLLLFQLSALYLFSCLVLVGPSEQAIIERFGRPVDDKVFGPGLHFKWPWPIETAHRFDTEKLEKHELHIGAVVGEHSEERPDHGHSHGHDHDSHGETQKDSEKGAILFSDGEDHGHREEYFLVSHRVEQEPPSHLFDIAVAEDPSEDTLRDLLERSFAEKQIALSADAQISKSAKQQWLVDDEQQEYIYIVSIEQQSIRIYRQKRLVVPVNLLLVHLLLNYRVKDIFAYTYNHNRPEDLIQHIGYREATRYFTQIDLNDAIAGKRLEISQVLKRNIQQKCDNNKLGVEITFLGVLEVHPPVEVMDSFIAMVAADEEYKTRISEAYTYAQKFKSEARSEKVRIHDDAEADAYEKELLTAAEAQMFAGLKKAYRVGGEVFTMREYLRVLERHLGKRRVYINNIGELDEQEDVLHLEDHLSSDITQLDLSDSPREE